MENCSFASNGRNLKLLCVIPNSTDGTSLYRGAYPIAKLRKENDNIQPVFVSDYNWASCNMADVAFFQRPYTDSQVTIMEICKSCRIPVWVDYDDDLLSVPVDNPSVELYGEEHTKNNIVKLLSMADVVSVSTPFLMHKVKQLEKFKKSPIDVRVIPNALDFDFIQEVKQWRKKLILWRGSNTHMRDIGTVGNEILGLEREFPEWTWHFLGYNPWFVTEFMDAKHVVYAKGFDAMIYMKFLQEIQPAVMIIPLVTCEFNLAKSNCSWLEGSLAGAVCVAPEIPEFMRPGILTYRNKEHFKEQMGHLLRGEMDMDAMVAASRKDIFENFNLAKVNKLRKDLICELTEKQRSSKVQHCWASGKVSKPTHKEHPERVLDSDCGTLRANQELLNASSSDVAQPPVRGDRSDEAPVEGTKEFRQLVWACMPHSVRSWKPDGMLSAVIIIQSPNWVTKEMHIRVTDIDNRVKPVLDAIEQATGISDERYWSVSCHKVCGKRDMTVIYLFSIGDVCFYHF